MTRSFKKNQQNISAKEKIFLASKELFYENGYLNTSFVQIAEKSGTSQGAIYHNYTSKSLIGNDVFLYFFENIKNTSRTMILKEKGYLDYKIAKMLGVMLQFYYFKNDYRAYKFYKEYHNNRYTGEYFPVPSDKLMVRMAASMDYELDKENDEALLLAILDREIVPRLFISYFEEEVSSSEEYMLRYLCTASFNFFWDKKPDIDKIYDETLKIFNQYNIEYKPIFEIDSTRKETKQ